MLNFSSPLNASHSIKNSEKFEIWENKTKFTERVSRRLAIVEFPISEPFNLQFWKFPVGSQIEWRLTVRNYRKFA